MPSREATEAIGVLRDLEAHWISLLLWLSERSGIDAADLVLVAGEAGEKARTNFEREKAQRPLTTFTPVHYLDFGAYVDVAAGNRQQLEALGQPPMGWT